MQFALEKILTICELLESNKVDFSPEICCAFCFTKKCPRKPHSTHSGPFRLKMTMLISEVCDEHMAPHENEP